MKKFTIILIIVCLQCYSCEQCSDYFQDETGCIQSTGISCRWIEQSNQCQESTGTLLGCQNYLNKQACISQKVYPNKSVAECIFSGYCRTVIDDATECQKNLSRAGCLGVEQGYCTWKDECIAITQSQAAVLAQATSATDELKLSSIAICQQIIYFPAIHQHGAHEALTKLYFENLTSSGGENEYEQQMLIPGCFQPVTDIYTQIKCDAQGLNSLACVLVQTEPCIFQEGKCQKVFNFATLSCSDKLNKIACLSITNYDETCYWTGSQCTKYLVTKTTACDISIQVSPSVCANIIKVDEACFYDEQTMKCDSMCKSASLTTATKCELSKYLCQWRDYQAGYCKFKGNECDRQGQNYISCMKADEYCLYDQGQCLSIHNLNLLGCSSGLNRQACINLLNPSQVCQFQDDACFEIYITPEDLADSLENVNQNACRKITTAASYWSDGKCRTASLNEECSIQGYNKLGCLNTLNTVAPCQWNGDSGSCQTITITKETKCESLKLVNAVACRLVQEEEDAVGTLTLCKYNINATACEKVTVLSSINCETEGLNEAACSSVPDPLQSCRWSSNQCVKITILGNAVTCQALQSVTQRTCAMIQSNNQRCVYDSSRKSCTTQVPPTTDCTAAGLNPYGCAFVSSQCHFDPTTNQCKSTDPSNYGIINCDTNFPSKSTCVLITKTYQYCRWLGKDNVCELFSFPASDSCTKYSNVNKLFCLAFEVSLQRYISSSYYCSYDSSTSSCTQYADLTAWADCGTTLDINLHACVALSNSSKNCYFDQTTLKCTEITDLNDSKFSSLLCKQANKLLCLSLSTTGQYCQWVDSEKKCQPIKSGQSCSDYVSMTVNPTLCASTFSDEACVSNLADSHCKVVLASDITYNCTDKGLNQKACLENTTGACYYDTNKLLCLEVSGQTAYQVSCFSQVNKLGCLASLQQNCKWIDTLCYYAYDLDPYTSSCTDFQSNLYNPKVCQTIYTDGQYCQYDSATFHCVSFSDLVQDCKPGYNYYTCSLNSLCLWDWNTESCQSSSSVGDSCKNLLTETDCLAVTNDTCSWTILNKCKKIVITEYTQCSQVGSAQGKFVKRICQSIFHGTDSCQYDSATKSCVAVTTTNNQCTSVGLNKKACFSNTIGYKCKFESDFTKDDYGCQEISDFSNQGCSDSLDSESCASVTVTQCAYDFSRDICEEYAQYYLYYYCTCAQFSTGYAVTTNLCKFVTDAACIYDATTQTCKVSTTQLDQCKSNTSINSVYCLTQIKTQTCSFDPIYGNFCQEADTSYWYCSDCLSYKQCVTSRLQICKWQDNQCVEITVDVQCFELTNINSNACMSFSGTTKCQFKYDSVAQTTSCIVPPDDIQPCSGLNQVACVTNTANSCFFYQQQCYDIIFNPYQASCTDEFSFNYKACVRIMNSDQKCKWDPSLNKCVSTTASSTDPCTAYADSNYSATICASIESGNCIWNNGCKAEVALSCQTLGANKGACINATAGSCVFSQGVCIDVTSPSDLVKNLCTDPSNKQGCLDMNEGQTCKWNGSACQEISVTAGCASYTNVNSGVCQNVTDVACQWVTDKCSVVTGKAAWVLAGLNKLACVTFTTVTCYFKSKTNRCTQVTQQALNELECTDNLNELACKSHQKKCCLWNAGKCQDATAGSTCSDLYNNSPYCCTILTGQACTMGITSCQELTEKQSQCSDAVNQNACQWVGTSCRWDSKLLNCIQVNKNYGCKPELNVVACVNQLNHCKYLNNSCMAASTEDNCKDLYNSSLSSTKCLLITNSRCLVSTDGCVVPPYNVKCTENINKLACLDNVNYCVWNDTAKSCNGKRLLTASTTCATGIVSRGICAFSKVQCKSESDYTCTTFTKIDDTNVTCDQRNAVLSSNYAQCLADEYGACQYIPAEQRCTSVIVGAVCTTIVTKLGCKLILNNCYWSSNMCLQYSTDKYFNTCEEIYTKYQCLVNINTSCYWDTDIFACKTYKGEVVTCAQHTELVISPGICFYFSSNYCGHNGKKCQQDEDQSICVNSKSPLGCQANTAGNCYWRIDTGKCIALEDSSLASFMTCVELKYSKKSLCLAPIIEGQTCHWKDNLCQSANIQKVTCYDDLSLDGCRAVAMWGWFCIFKEKCEIADIDNIHCNDYINIYSCLSVTLDGQYCKWLGQRCYSLDSEDGFELSSHILINANVCRKAYTISGVPDNTLKQIGVSYDSANYVCQLSDPEYDQCSTPGLNYYGCLSTQADACDWTGSKCKVFDFSVTYTQCNQYLSVSPKVCASINTSNLKCQHNSITFNCENFSETTEIFVPNEDGLFLNTKKGMNRLACISVQKQPTIWASGRCEYNHVKTALITCGELIDVNPKSCAQIDKDNVTCKYFKDGTCTAQFDPQVDKCTTPGLNIVGCISIETELCLFSQGSCSKYEISNIIKCIELRNVNALVCKNVINQQCKFSFTNRGCVQSYSNDKCSYSGLNQFGCNKTTQCQWIDDRCFCKGEVTSLQLIDCTTFTTSDICQKQKLCIFDQLTGLCRNKRCSDLPYTSCSGMIAKSICYFNLNKCSSASKCSELFNIDCSLYTIAGKKCAQDIWNINHCVDQECQHFNEDQCTGNCQWSYSQCVLKECNYMKKESCTGIMNKKQCYWDGSYCQALNSCKDYITYSKLTDTTLQQNLCTSSTFLNKRCRWELIDPYGTDYQCSSKLCYDQGTSQSTCHGFQAEGEVCVLLPDFTCVACSEITDSCTCLNMNGYCYYSEIKGCMSNLCSDLDQASCAATSQRCTYINNQCKPSCAKLRSIECTARQQSNECHWNSNVLRCLDGAAPVVNLNTMEEVIVIESSISKINQMIIMLIMIYIN